MSSGNIPHLVQAGDITSAVALKMLQRKIRDLRAEMETVCNEMLSIVDTSTADRDNHATATEDFAMAMVEFEDAVQRAVNKFCTNAVARMAD